MKPHPPKSLPHAQPVAQGLQGDAHPSLDLLGPADLLAPKGDSSELRFETIGLLRCSLERFKVASQWHAGRVAPAAPAMDNPADLLETAVEAFTDYQFVRIATDFLDETEGLGGKNEPILHGLRVAGGVIHDLCHRLSAITATHFRSGHFVQHFCGPFWAEQDRRHWDVLESVQEHLKQGMENAAILGGPDWIYDFLKILDDLDTDQIAALLNSKGEIPFEESEDDPPLAAQLESSRNAWHAARDALAEAAAQLKSLDCGLSLAGDYAEPPTLQEILRTLAGNGCVPAGLPGILAMLLEERLATHFTPALQGNFQVNYQHRARTAAAQHDFWQWWLLDHFRTLSDSAPATTRPTAPPPTTPRPLSVLDPALVELLEHALVHPKHLRAHACPPRLQPLRTALQPLCNLWLVQRPELELAQLLNALSTHSAPTVALAFGVFMRALIIHKLQLRSDRTFIQGINAFLRTRMLPRLDELVDNYTLTTEPAITTTETLQWDRQWRQLLEEEARQKPEHTAAPSPTPEACPDAASRRSPSAPCPTAPIDEDPASATRLASEQIALRFLTNPGCDTPKFHPPVLISQADIAPLHQLANEVGLESDIPVQSIARAVSHYIWDTPPTIRACMNKLHFAGRTWHKIKRGKMRIYLRFSETDELLISVIMRRDWDRMEMDF